eukprot:comp23457_c0_seq1/m.39166 comp23457_c0_seq1/g.39166  ORF comp23457_c0_seq1/g.39166 comp23457_c0_seq1/m.39166 type:complete len:488 (-) comp23457_c0_seq1:116-1579(-)
MKPTLPLHAFMCALTLLSVPLLSHSQPAQTVSVIDPFGPETGLPPDVTSALSTESTPFPAPTSDPQAEIPTEVNPAPPSDSTPIPAPASDPAPVVTTAATAEEKQGFFGSLGSMVADAATSTGQKVIDKATSSVKETVLSGVTSLLPIPDIPWDTISTYACYAAMGVNTITSLKLAFVSSQEEINQLKNNIAQLRGKTGSAGDDAKGGIGAGMTVYPEKAPPTVVAFEGDRLVGRWYQTMQNLFVTASSQVNATCPIFDFAYPAGTSVLNVRVGFSQTGGDGNTTYVSYQGPLSTPNASAPGQLLADFPSGTCAFEPIFLLALGPVSTTTGLYDWALISDPYRMSVYALARDARRFDRQYRRAVETALSQIEGFDGFLRKLRPSNQPNTCVYPEAFVAPIPPPPANDTTAPSLGGGILDLLNPNRGSVDNSSNSAAVLGAIIGTFIAAVLLVGLIMAFYVYGPQTRRAFGKRVGSDDELSKVGLAYH